MPFNIKRGDTSPAIRYQLNDGTGSTVNLTGATVDFHMRRGEYDLTVSSSATIISEENGVVEYQWQAGDTDTTGTFRAEWEVRYADGTIETFPNSDYITIKILDDLN